MLRTIKIKNLKDFKQEISKLSFLKIIQKKNKCIVMTTKHVNRIQMFFGYECFFKIFEDLKLNSGEVDFAYIDGFYLLDNIQQVILISQIIDKYEVKNEN